MRIEGFKEAKSLRPLPIFSKFGLIFMANDRFWWLLFIGRFTGSGTAATGSGTAATGMALILVFLQ